MSNVLLAKVKTMDFSETKSACDMKVGRCRQLTFAYLKSRSFLDLGPW